MKTKMEYRKGVLFIRIKGMLTLRNINRFESDVLPIILKQGIRYVVLNLNEVTDIDDYGISCLESLHELIKRNNGRSSLCSINDSIKDKIINSKLYNVYFNTENELTALEMFKL